MKDAIAVELEAEVRQIKSMADNTYNLTVNVPEYCLEQVQILMGWLKGMVKIVMVYEGDPDD
jgi:hypothetical protein